MAHLATQQGRRVVERLLAGRHGGGEAALPRLVQTGPALAQVGVLAGDAKGRHVMRANLAEYPAAQLQGAGHGMIKLVLDPTGKIIGAGCVGPQAGELVAMLALAMGRGLDVQDLADLVLPQPSLAAPLADLGAQFAREHPRVPRRGQSILQRLQPAMRRSRQ
jgi:pyruvate/2-oxoglutarate dehydrogenase complex dihydrolipoamide dehydrogenase (E3) component